MDVKSVSFSCIFHSGLHPCIYLNPYTRFIEVLFNALLKAVPNHQPSFASSDPALSSLALPY